MAVMCEHCKWGIVTKFNPQYGGCVIGCTKPGDDNKLGQHCYESKEKEEKK